MVEVFFGQAGRAVVKMFDDQGRATTKYDEIAGVSYTSDAPDIVGINDEDANPFDATFSFLRPHAAGEAPTRVRVAFDGAPGDPERPINLQSEEITVLEPPPGEAFTGVVDIELSPV